MIIQENLSNGLVRTYSNSGFKVHGGSPEGNYDIVYDPEEAQRQYTETNIPIDEEAKEKDISKVKLFRALKKIGIWEQIKTWMQESEDDKWEEWKYSSSLKKYDTLVSNIVSELQNTFSLSQEEINDMFSNCEED